jgi:pimeloyl-ACP methyl ester carboxylesterase
MAIAQQMSDAPAPAAIAYDLVGKPPAEADHIFLWCHGWGQDRRAFAAFPAAFPRAAHLLIDLPGFGQSPPPNNPWGTKDFSEAVVALLDTLAFPKPVIWVGHSHGGRIGLDMASRHADRLKALCLIAGAGLKRKRGLIETIQLKSRIYAYKAAKKLFGAKMQDKFGSADYRNAGPALRATFVRVVNEDFTGEAKTIKTPTLLLYGADDGETPPEIGERLANLIPGAQLSVLANQDHYSVIGQGRHVVLKRLTEFVAKL